MYFNLGKDWTGQVAALPAILDLFDGVVYAYPVTVHRINLGVRSLRRLQVFSKLILG